MFDLLSVSVCVQGLHADTEKTVAINHWEIMRTCSERRDAAQEQRSTSYCNPHRLMTESLCGREEGNQDNTTLPMKVT